MGKSDFRSLRDALGRAKTLQDAVRNLYAFNKGIDRKRSLAYICKRAGIASTGYLSDVINGKRPLNGKYVGGLCAAFRLDQDEGAYFAALAAGAADRAETLRRVLRSRSRLMDHSVSPRLKYFALELSCAVNTRPGGSTFAELEAFYGAHRQGELRAALIFLEERGAVTRRGERYVAPTDYTHWDEANNRDYLAELYRVALFETLDKVERYAGNREEAQFESFCVNVDPAAYRAALPMIRAEIRKLVLALNTDHGAGMVRWNVQIFPVEPQLSS